MREPKAFICNTETVEILRWHASAVLSTVQRGHTCMESNHTVCFIVSSFSRNRLHSDINCKAFTSPLSLKNLIIFLCLQEGSTANTINWSKLFTEKEPAWGLLQAVQWFSHLYLHPSICFSAPVHWPFSNFCSIPISSVIMIQDPIVTLIRGRVNPILMYCNYGKGFVTFSCNSKPIPKTEGAKKQTVRTKILLWNFLENTNHKSPENHFFFLMYLDWSTHPLWSTSNPKIQVLLPRNTVIQEFLTSKEHVWWLQRTLSFSTALNSTFINKN